MTLDTKTKVETHTKNIINILNELSATDVSDCDDKNIIHTVEFSKHILKYMEFNRLLGELEWTTEVIEKDGIEGTIYFHVYDMSIDCIEWEVDSMISGYPTSVLDVLEKDEFFTIPVENSETFKKYSDVIKEMISLYKELSDFFGSSIITDLIEKSWPKRRGEE